MSLGRYTERTPLKEEVDPVLRRKRLLKIGGAAVLIALGFMDGTIPDAVSNLIDFANNMNIADFTDYDPNSPPIIDSPIMDPANGVMS